MLSGSRITTNDVVSAIASLKSRRGSRYTDIVKTLRSSGAEPSFTQVKAAMVKASEDGVVNQTSSGLWQLGSAKKNYTDSTVLQRRGRRKGGRSRRRGRHSRRRRSRRRRQGRGRKARKGRGRKVRKGRGRKARKGRGRKEREERGRGKRRRSRRRH